MDLSAYAPPVRALLAASAPMPLIRQGGVDAQVRRQLRDAVARDWFPSAPHAEAALAGLWLRCGGWEEAHNISQDIASPEGSYWHAIVHRQEPDAWNSGYWFRRVGAHSIFPALLAESAGLCRAHAGTGFTPGASWDPIAFIDFCTGPASNPGSRAEALALAIQEAEWWLLFNWCAGVSRIDAGEGRAVRR